MEFDIELQKKIIIERQETLHSARNNQEAEERRENLAAELERARRPYELIKKLLSIRGYSKINREYDKVESINIYRQTRKAYFESNSRLIKERFDLNPSLLIIDENEHLADLKLEIKITDYDPFVEPTYEKCSLGLVLSIGEEPETYHYLAHIDEPRIYHGGKITEMYGMRIYDAGGRNSLPVMEDEAKVIIRAIEEAAELSGAFMAAE